MEEFKEYLSPNYSPNDFEDPPFDSLEDDDDDDDYSDTDEGEEDEKMNNYLEEQEKLNKKIMTQSPFQSPNQQNTTPQWGAGNNTWGGQQNTPWGQQNNNQPSWGTSWQKPSWGQNQPSWGTGGNSWGGNNYQQSGNQRMEINRKKKYIFCDVLDCLIETWQSNGKPGLLPRGIYDIRLKFEVWDKLACFNPEKIYALIPRNLILSSNGSDSWRVLLDYVTCSLSEYLRVPYGNCVVITQKDFGLSKNIVFKTIINEQLDKKDVIQIGIDSGLMGQSDKDAALSKDMNIDYIDLGQLMTIYY